MNQEQIKLSEEKFRRLIENSSDIISIMALNGEILYQSPTCQKIFGYTPEEMLGNSAYDYIHPDDRNNVINTLAEGLRKDLKIGNVECRFKHKDGSWVCVESIGSNFMEYQGIQGIVVNTRDVSERKKAEKKIIEADKKLKKLNQELENRIELRTRELQESESKLKEQNLELKLLDQLKNDFITMAAHELKTPLSSIIGYSELMQMKFNNINPEMRDDIIRIQSNAKRLEIYINHLIDIMKIDANKMKIKREVENINDIIEDCLLDLELLIKNKDVQIDIQFPKDLVIKIDRLRIFEVFCNLISNAVKFSPNSGKVEISVESIPNFYRFSIKDSGIGLSKEEIDKLFGKFVTLNKNVDEYKEGSGLGLYISKGIVEAHGGIIWAKSDGIGKGSEFFFTLPKS